MESANLLDRITQHTNLSEEQAIKALAVVADYTKEKFPILEGNINSFLKQEFKAVNPGLLSQIFGD